MEEEQLEIKELNFNEQLAENENIESYDEMGSYENKRDFLDKTKIVKQSWSIIEIYQKINNGKLILNPDYQRNEIWDQAKKTAFIESLYMGIIIPPIYVVEIPNEDILMGNNYEVVDGKQRLSTIRSYIENQLVLKEKHLEYYADLFGEKRFAEVQEKYSKETTEMLSSVLDVYVITANSPEFTKYDIFSRLNKGSEKLKANEIRKAVYHSELTKIIDEYVKNNQNTQKYKQVFSENNRKRYDDYGRFYKSIAFYLRSNKENKCVLGYNSRPREMINTVMQEFQFKNIEMNKTDIETILEKTLELLVIFENIENKEYIIDSCIPFVIEECDKLFQKIDMIKNDSTIKATLQKSPATTINVNKRFERVMEILNENN